jgi:hypothetical protein
MRRYVGSRKKGATGERDGKASRLSQDAAALA